MVVFENFWFFHPFTRFSIDIYSFLVLLAGAKRPFLMFIFIEAGFFLIETAFSAMMPDFLKFIARAQLLPSNLKQTPPPGSKNDLWQRFF